MPIPKKTLTNVNTFDIEHVKAIVVAYLKKAAGLQSPVRRFVDGLAPAQAWIVDGAPCEYKELMWDKFMPSIEALREDDDDAFAQCLAELHDSGWLNDKQFNSTVRAIKF